MKKSFVFPIIGIAVLILSMSLISAALCYDGKYYQDCNKIKYDKGIYYGLYDGQYYRPYDSKWIYLGGYDSYDNYGRYEKKYRIENFKDVTEYKKQTSWSIKDPWNYEKRTSLISQKDTIEKKTKEPIYVKTDEYNPWKTWKWKDKKAFGDNYKYDKEDYDDCIDKCMKKTNRQDREDCVDYCRDNWR